VRALNYQSRAEAHERNPLAYCGPVTLVAPPDDEQQQVKDTTPKLQNVIAAARPKLSDAESRELYKLTEYRDIFAMKREMTTDGPKECTTL
jgi:hypothetical protein